MGAVDRYGWLLDLRGAPRASFAAALRSSNAFPLVFETHLQPRFFPSFDPKTDGVTLSRLWGEEDHEDFIAAKLRDKAKYDADVRRLFSVAKAARCKQE